MCVSMYLFQCWEADVQITLAVSLSELTVTGCPPVAPSEQKLLKLWPEIWAVSLCFPHHILK